MRVCLIASSRFPIAEPFHGGLEAHTASLAQALTARGHDVQVFAAPGSDHRLNVRELTVPTAFTSMEGRTDLGSTTDEWMQEHHAYLSLMLDLARRGRDRFDVIHNNCLHHIPIAMAEVTGLPSLTTLHTPPIDWLESAMVFAPDNARFAAVSNYTARTWAHAVDATVVLNGVDTSRWTPGGGGTRAIWSGRIVRDKAPHLAVRGAHAAGLSIDVAGPVQDRAYFDAEVGPMLRRDDRFLGHLRTSDLSAVTGSAAVALVTPEWDEPYGLVAAEAMACGTPVAAFGRGALPEIVAPGAGVIAPCRDVDGLAWAIREAIGLDRVVVRRHALRELSLDRMTSDYEQLYEGMLDRVEAA